MENPFPLEPYTSKELFCDREQELSDIDTKSKVIFRKNTVNGYMSNRIRTIEANS